MKSKLTQSNIAKPKCKQQKKKAATIIIQSSLQPNQSDIYFSEDSELTDTDDENISEA